MKTTGDRFREIRQELNFTQAGMGAELGLTSQGISNIEKNKSFLTLDKLQILKKFNINLNYLIYGTGVMFTAETESLCNAEKAGCSEERIEKIMLRLLKKNGIIK